MEWSPCLDWMKETPKTVRGERELRQKPGDWRIDNIHSPHVQLEKRMGRNYWTMLLYNASTD